MIASCLKPRMRIVTSATVVDFDSMRFRSQYADLPLTEFYIEIDSNTAISSLDVTVNGTTRTFTFDEAITKGTLDVLTGILTKADDSTYAMGGMEVNAILGWNTISTSVYVKKISASYNVFGR